MTKLVNKTDKLMVSFSSGDFIRMTEGSTLNTANGKDYIKNWTEEKYYGKKFYDKDNKLILLGSRGFDFLLENTEANRKRVQAMIDNQKRVQERKEELAKKRDTFLDDLLTDSDEEVLNKWDFINEIGFGTPYWDEILNEGLRRGIIHLYGPKFRHVNWQRNR